MSDFRTLPQSTEAERAVLGAILIKPIVIHDVVGHVSSEDFTSETHRNIYLAMLSLHQSSTTIDIVTLSEKLKARAKLEDIGGDSYLADLLTAVPSAANIEHYVGIIRDIGTKRQLIEACEEIALLGLKEDAEAEILLDAAEQKLSAIAQGVSLSDFHEMPDEISAAKIRLDALQSGENKLRGVPSGFPSLDKVLAGFQKSDLIILAARPSVGKTSLALDIARKITVGSDKRVAIFSLEMSKEQLIDKMLAAERIMSRWVV